MKTLARVVVLATAVAVCATPAQAQRFPQISEGALIVHAYDAQRLVIAIDTSKPPDGRVDEELLVDLAAGDAAALERGVSSGRVEVQENGLLVQAKGRAPLAFVLQGERARAWAVPPEAELRVAVAIVSAPARGGLSLQQTLEHFDAQALDSEIGAERRLTDGVRASQRANWERIRRTFASLAPEQVEALRAAGQLHLFQQAPPGDPGSGSCSPACYIGCGAASGQCSSLCSAGLCATCACVDSQPWCACVR
jgi:hypothetical protein